jgi:hypothetical protein
MYENYLTLDGHDNAIIGIASTFGREDVLAYDINIIIENLVTHGLTITEATEYFDYNIIGAYLGENTPIYITKGN